MKKKRNSKRKYYVKVMRELLKMHDVWMRKAIRLEAKMIRDGEVDYERYRMHGNCQETRTGEDA